jgi:anti-sigma28 factor (negative regulator of flagellin synthesis)
MIKNKNSSKNGQSMLTPESSRAARIQSLKKAIAAGTYRIDNRLVADSLLVNLFRDQLERVKKC